MYAPAKFETDMDNGLDWGAFTKKKKYSILTFNIDFDVKVARDVAQCPLYHWKHIQSLKMLCTVLEMHLQENIVFDLCPCGQGHTRWVKFPLQHNHVTYVPAKFDVATSNG